MGRYTKREHTAGAFWLDQRSGSPAYYICWMQDGQRQRLSTGTADLEQAKAALRAHYIKHGEPEGQDVTAVPIAEVIERYWEQHGQHQSASKWLKYACGHWVSHFGQESVWDATRPPRIERFITHLKSTGIGMAYINAILTAGKAALNRAFKRGELSRQVYVPSVKVPKAQPKGRPLSVDECAAWLDASAPHFHALLFICLATGSRPCAVKELRWNQIEMDEGLMHLNPEGREQTPKHRPVVKMPPALVAYLRTLPRQTEWVVSYGGKPVNRYYTALGESRKRAGLDERVNLYSPRHTVSRWMRKERVPFEELSGQLGHKVAGFAITEIYAAYSPDFQALATAAIETLLRQIALKSRSCAFLAKDWPEAKKQQASAET